MKDLMLKDLNILGEALISIGYNYYGLDIIKMSQNTDPNSRWSEFLENTNDYLPYSVRFLPIGMDSEAGDFDAFVKENLNSLNKIDSIAGGTLPTFLAHGTMGSAFSIGSDKILKFVTDAYEFKSYQVMLARRSRGGDLGLEAPEIFALGELKFEGKICSYWVVMERLHTDSSLIEEERGLLLDMLSMILGTLWFQPDSNSVFSSQTPEHGESLDRLSLENNWSRFKAKAVRSISSYGFSSDPFGTNKFEALFKISPECLEDFEESNLNRYDINELSIWLLESDVVNNLLNPYLTQIMLNVAHGYLDFQSQNLGWRKEDGHHRPIFFDPGYNFKSMAEDELEINN